MSGSLFATVRDALSYSDSGAHLSDENYDAAVSSLGRIEEQYAELEKAAAALVAQPFGSLDQRAFYRLREVLGG